MVWGTPLNKPNLRRGIRQLEAVLSYGVDGLSELVSRTTVLGQFGLSSDVFFDKLYVSRPLTEAEIKSQFEAGTLHSFLVGSIGCGKTTLLHFAVREYSKELGLPFLLIDFKTLAQRNPDKYQFDEMMEANGISQIARFLKTYRRDNWGNPRPEQLQPGIADLARIILKSENRAFVSAENSSYSRTLESEYDHSIEKQKGMPFDAWLDLILDDRAHESHATVAVCIKAYTREITLAECAFAVSEFVRLSEGRKRFHKLVIAFDNIDAISDLKLRDQFIGWMAKASNSYAAVATFISCIRPQNLNAFQDKFIEESNALWGDDGTTMLKLSVGDNDVTDETLQMWERHLEGQYFDHQFDELDTLELSPDQKQRIVFDDMVHAKRFDFIAEVIESGNLGDVTVNDLKAVSDAAKEVLNILVVARDICMQSNGNRRILLSGVANFLEYVTRDLDLEWEKIGTRKTGQKMDRDRKRNCRGSAIKSLYYRFLGAAKADDPIPPVFDPRLFDPVASALSCGWHGRKLPDNIDADFVAEQCKSMLVMMSVHNACGNTVDYWSEEAIHTRGVAAKCGEFGLQELVVYDTLNDAVSTVSARFAGFFDIDHFHAISEGRYRINGDERIVATDRCRQILQQVIYMFNYLAERLRRYNAHKQHDRAVNKRLLQRGLVEPDVIREFSEWIAKFVVVETWLIEAVQAAAGHSLKDAHQSYCDLVVVKKTHSSKPTLICKRMVASALNYIDYSLKNHISRDEERLVDAYKSAREDLRNIQWKLGDVCERIGKGEPWAIPRNEALRY